MIFVTLDFELTKTIVGKYKHIIFREKDNRNAPVKADFLVYAEMLCEVLNQL